jgi:hypothetical protein
MPPDESIERGNPFQRLQTIGGEAGALLVSRRYDDAA